MEQPDWRNEKFTYDRFYFQITFGIIVIVIAILIGFVLFPEDMGYRSNLYTTAVGALISVAFLDLLNRRREAENLKAQLIRELRSSDNGLALRALEELSNYKWLHDGSLKEKNFVLPGDPPLGANLQHAQFLHANLEGTFFMYANFSSSFFYRANLSGASLQHSNLSNATLSGTDLRGANLRYTNLAGAEINYMLRGIRKLSELGKASKNDVIELVTEVVAKLGEKPCLFDEKTTLPDGSLYKPTLGLDQLKRFTDKSHPQFFDVEAIKTLLDKA
jgi:hypothetical protein